jgi:hypothetical protein
VGAGMTRQSLNWDDMIESLVAFRKEHGHCNVRANWRKNPQLGRWVAMQRYRRKIGELSQKCVEHLDKLGFVWSPTDSVWNAMFDELCDFKKKCGHCDVPTQWAGNPHLANWVANQRHRRKMGTLPSDRAKRLDELGFVWSVYGKDKGKKIVPDVVDPPAPRRKARATEERLYHVGIGVYVQHNGADPMPAKLERYLAQHHSEYPPYIPLPEGSTEFRIGEDLVGPARRYVWPGEGPLPEEVREFVNENGVLPPHR